MLHDKALRTYKKVAIKWREGGREGGREGQIRKLNTVQVILDFQSNEFTSQFQTRSDRRFRSIMSAAHGFLM